MKLIGIVGTNSDRSTNRKLMQYMKEHFSDQVEIEVCEIKDFPAFDEPEEKTSPSIINLLSEKIDQADGVIISTPEYDHSIPAALKSMLEWLSYTTRPLMDKPVMIVGASHGSLGSSRAQAHLRQILNAPELKARVMSGTEFLLGQSLQAFDEDGQLIYPEKVKELEESMDDFLLFVDITNQLMASNPYKTKKDQKVIWEQAVEGVDKK
ncbi:NADPH-dependent FMN reductase [Enterococcus gilvus]|uniref:NADPH-dependent FMN reductase n=1 Tax=Enterococcus gilvus TaxID=160453 RepID=UPI002905FB03|nr:NADPH-dependent FMN reductase [Enterococcus gilvus]MDU5511789.1 NADPH-dependent FMN reductase [Enterococcus gilvus]